jgi:hypothetical protein
MKAKTRRQQGEEPGLAESGELQRQQCFVSGMLSI